MRTHHIRGIAVVLIACAPETGCGSSFPPRPPPAAVAQSDYVAVTFPPRTPPVEFVPPLPDDAAVWVDGTWDWTGERYAWRSGRWVVPPPGARYARWTLVRRAEDGQLFFAPSSWKDAAGQTLDDREFSRPGGEGGREGGREGWRAKARAGD